MLWQWLGLDRKIEALFDEGWISLGLESVKGHTWPSSWTLNDLIEECAPEHS